MNFKEDRCWNDSFLTSQVFQVQTDLLFAFYCCCNKLPQSESGLTNATLLSDSSESQKSQTGQQAAVSRGCSYFFGW